VFRAELASAMKSALESALKSAVCIGWAEVHLFSCDTGVCVDVLWCHFAKEGIRACGFNEA